MDTKAKAIEAALKLFAENGYKGTSVKQIAEAVGIKDASLYKHFKSKQEIFDSIVVLINEHISSMSAVLDLPQLEALGNGPTESYKELSAEALKDLSQKAFLFFLTDPYISKFWRIAHMEQYRNERIYGMFRKIFMEDAISYQTWLFAEMMKAGVLLESDPRTVAIVFYAPFFLLLTKYANHADGHKEAMEILDKQVEEFLRMYMRGII